MNIIARQAEHYDAIENLLDESFGKDRHQRISYAIRAGTSFIPDLSFVMIENQKLIATISCWSIYLSTYKDGKPRNLALIMVGPIAVAQSHQNLGYGRKLVNKVIEIAHENALDDLIMIGDPEYYSQFGFASMDACDWQLPGPYENHRLLVHGDAVNRLPNEGILGPKPQDITIGQTREARS